MATFHFELVSPEKLVFSGEVEHVVVPGSEGEFGVLAGHAPVIAMLKPGILRVIGGSAGETRLFVRGGFAEAGPTGLTVLAEEAVPVAELDTAKIDAAIKDAEEDVADAKDDAGKAAAAMRLNQLRDVKTVLAQSSTVH